MIEKMLLYFPSSAKDILEDGTFFCVAQAKSGYLSWLQLVHEGKDPKKLRKNTLLYWIAVDAELPALFHLLVPVKLILLVICSVAEVERFWKWFKFANNELTHHRSLQTIRDLATISFERIQRKKVSLTASEINQTLPEYKPPACQWSNPRKTRKPTTRDCSWRYKAPVQPADDELAAQDALGDEEDDEEGEHEQGTASPPEPQSAPVVLASSSSGDERTQYFDGTYASSGE